jgi:ectoine hydrolase
MPGERIHGYHDDYVMSTERHPMQHLAELLRESGFANKRIGVEMENYYFSAAAWETLKRELPDAHFVDATALVNWKRLRKSPAELAYIRQAAAIVTSMHETIRERIKPGLRKNELVAEIFATGIRGAEGGGGDYPAIVPLLPTGKDASAAHLTWDDKPFERGAATFFEIAGCVRRYHARLCRTVYLGKPPLSLLDAE